MTSTTEHDHQIEAAGDHDEHDAHGGHPSEATYIKIAVILATITAAEVGLYYKSLSSTAANNSALLVLAAAKFIIVAAYFMHLKFDNKILRRLFTTGFVLATFCYIAYLTTLGVFSSR